MQLRRRQFLQLAAGAAALPTTLRMAQAQGYPSRPITIVVGLAAGGPTDYGARLLAEGLKPLLGQPILVENIVGATGSIGVGKVVRAAPDGYTLSMGDLTTFVTNQVMLSLPYDVRTDLQPIALLRTTPLLIVARSGMPGADLKEMVAWLRENPDKASVGTAGAGGNGHLAGLIFQDITGTRVQFVPYRGEAPAIQEMLSGHIDMTFATPFGAMPFIQARQLKAYAIMAKSRLELLPDVPTVDEAGAPGAHFASWLSLWAPKGTPKNVVATLNAAVVTALADPTFKARFADAVGSSIAPPDQQSPEGLAVFHKAEIDRWWPIFNALNIKGG
jgi:tripartite-type tricarboxylate transporter receptor subunit TctC